MNPMKTLSFEGHTLETIKAFPDNARQRVGYELYRVQCGLDPENWKPFSTIGQGVREIRIQVGTQYRVIYLTKIADKVHVLHAFQKKTQKTAKTDIDYAKQQLKALMQQEDS